MRDREVVEALVTRARAAQRQYGEYNQEQVDEVVTAVAWAGYKKENAEALARLAFEETGIGNYEDKVAKIRRKTLGALRDLRGAKSVGVIDVDEARGITQIAKPMGVVAAILPVTNPAATAINNIMITLKGRNAVILAPHPKGERTCAEVIRLVHHEMAKLKAPLDLVQYLSLKAADKAASRVRSQELMRQVDFVFVTSGPTNVRVAYSSGTPAHGVGPGNVPVIIDASADIPDVVRKIVASKTFDYATSCSSENALVIEASVYDAVIRGLQAYGGYLVTPEEKPQLQEAMWKDGGLNRAIVAQSARVIAELAGLKKRGALESKLLIVEEEEIGEAFPFSGEKLSVVLTAYKYTHFDEALEKVNRILAYMGLGHSCGIHSKNEQHIQRLAESAKVARVLVNQAHCFGNGGNFDNGLDFTLSMGAGSWGKNSTCDNIAYKHFLNITRLARVIPAQIPSEDELWGGYLKRYGG
ncbi:MAG: aldehyde dehydrogenase family protein [Candidatus Methylomirabilales bacterium]